MNKRHNILWIVLDGVRNYPCPDDPQRMGRPPLFDSLGKEGVYFENVVTSGTSTIMAVSGMMMSIPSYYLSRNLKDFRIDKSSYESFASILEKNGYKVYSITISYEMRRDSWVNILRPIDERYWPKGEKRLRHWTNDPLNPIAFKLLDEGIKEPFFLYMHYNARRDSSVSDRVEKLLDKLKEKNLYDDTILVLCSDHGIPDTARSDYAKWLRDRGLYFNRHDLIMTDDNIMIPLFIKYPDGPKGIKIKPCVGNIDISPTLLDIVGIKSGPKAEYGKSFRGETLLPLMEGNNEEYYKERKFRTDTRYIAQKDRIISIRGTDYKYINFRDIPGTDNEQFFDLIEDPFESDNLIGSVDEKIKSKIEEYRIELERQEEDALKFQREFLLSKFKNKVSRLKLNSFKTDNPKMLLFGTCHESFLQLAYDAIKMKWIDADIDYFAEPYSMPDTLKVPFRNAIIFDRDRFDHKRKEFFRYIEEYDYIFVPLTDYLKDIEQSQGISTEGDMQFIQAPKPISSSLTKDYKSIFKIAKMIKSNGIIYFDYNMELYKNPHLIFFNKYAKIMLAKRDIYLGKPSELYQDIKRYISGDIS